MLSRGVAVVGGQDYLLKMYGDLDFVGDALGPEARGIGNYCHGNPLLLSEDELQGRGIRAQLGRAHAAGGQGEG